MLHRPHNHILPQQDDLSGGDRIGTCKLTEVDALGNHLAVVIHTPPGCGVSPGEPGTIPQRSYQPPRDVVYP